MIITSASKLRPLPRAYISAYFGITTAIESEYKQMSTETNSYNVPTTSSPTRVRCINLDWLEVHAYEPVNEPRDADYYRARGFVVHEREYGTRVYRQMFKLEGTDGYSLLEVRRDPASQGSLGIHQSNECHIRLTNRTCYFDDAAAQLKNFLEVHGYKDVRISRVDVCLDFVKFDKNDDPQAFVRRYFRHVYAKINQGNIHSHGADTWSGQEWNSLSWGAPTSDVSTKMYNKTMELYDPRMDTFGKPYIRQAWFQCHMIDDIQRCTKDGQLVNVWRVEFSIRSSVRKWFKIELNGNARKYQSIQNNLDTWAGRDRLLVMFGSLANHYFHFKYYDPNQRKDRCKDKVLFDFSGEQFTYKVDRRVDVLAESHRQTQPLERIINKLRIYKMSKGDPEILHACDVLIEAMTSDTIAADLGNPWSHSELLALKAAVAIKSRYRDTHVEVIMREIKQLLRINDNTAIF